MPSSRKSRPLDRAVDCVRDARLLVIATEGEKTEPRYFSILRSTKLQVRTIASEGGRSSPDHVLSNLERFSREFQIGEDDQLWLAIDKDAWEERTLSNLAREVQSRGWYLALSNPCFELWLALHLDAELPEPVDADTLTRHIRSIIGEYNKRNLNVDAFRGRIRQAEARARILDRVPQDRWPQDVATRVYQITEQFEHS